MTVSFPHIGNYCIPVEILLKFIFPDAKILVAPPITKKTIDLGARHSPDFVCSPFKYNLGNFIESLENGADVLIQAGGGCRYGFYGELQEQILKDLGYKFKFVNLFDSSGIKLISLYKTCKALGSNLSFAGLIYYLLLTVKMINIMDRLDMYMRENIGFETVENSFLTLQKQFFGGLKNVKNIRGLNKTGRFYRKQYRQVKVNKPDKILRIGMVGELYSLMEPFANYFMEKELAKNNIAISRYINVSYLLFKKTRCEKKTLKQAGKYLKYHIGAGGTDSVAKTRILAQNGYDGIIHVKPFGCTPEVNAMPMLMNINKDYKIPVLYFSFDSQTSETGVKTRLEAFYDMLKMKKEKSR